MNLAFWKVELCYCMLYTSSPGIFLLETYSRYFFLFRRHINFNRVVFFPPSFVFIVIETAMDKEGTVITLLLSLLLKINPIFIDIYPSCIGMNIIISIDMYIKI